MKKLKIFILILLVPWLIQAQTQKVSVFSAGGGAAQSAGYSNFSTIGQPLSVGTLGTNYMNNEGFIFAQQNIITATITANETICYDSPASLLNSEYTGAEGDVTYQWQVWNGASWQDLTGKNSATCNPGNLTETTQFRLLVNDKSGIGQAISNTVTITVYDEFLTGSIETEGETICYGGNPSLIGNETLATGGDESISYLWQSSVISATSGFTNITGAESSTYDPPAELTDTTWYRRLARDGTCNTTLTVSSGAWKVTIQQNPVANAGIDNTIVEDEEYQFVDAAKSHETAIEWTTTGDGSFDAGTDLNPIYTPGEDDIAAGSVELCLKASPTSPCSLNSTDCMTLTIWRNPTLSITSPADGSSVYTNPVTISGTANDADGNLSIVQVKLNSGTWQTATGTDSWNIDLNLVAGKNTILARAVDSTSLYSDTATINVLLSIQIINIAKGWSAISSYLTPLNLDLPVMMDEITSNQNLIIQVTGNGAYWPSQNYNTIGNWSVESGYKVKMNNAQEFTVRGDTLASRSLSLSQGYHIIPVLTNVGCPITSVFAEPLNDIFFMYDVKTNALYWPQGEIFSLTTLEPGKGYVASLNKTVTLTYPVYSGLKSGIIPDNTEPETNGPWPLIRTGDVHFVAISSEAANKLENASFIGAFDSFGNCIGFAEVNGSGENYLLSVYGNDAFTDAKDGAEESEPISFRSYNSSTQTETELIAEFNTNFANTDGLFASNGQSAIINFKESTTGIVEAGIAVEVLIYPNPAKDVVNIATKGFRTLEGFGTLLTAEGKLIKTFTITGNHTQLDVQDLQPGVYILRIENTESVVVKRLVIQ